MFSSVAQSMAVQARAMDPSARARSAAGVTQWAANSGWWLTAGSESMPMPGWIEGTTWETLPMSDEPGGMPPASPSPTGRPSARKADR
jgi:hypothetical protein